MRRILHLSGKPSTPPECNSCEAPMYQQVVDWLREEHNIWIWVSTIAWYVKRDRADISSYCDDYYKGLRDAIAEALKLI